MSKVALRNFGKGKLRIENCPEEVTQCIGQKLKDFAGNFNRPRRWKQVHRVKGKFLSKYSSWLQHKIIFQKLYII